MPTIQYKNSKGERVSGVTTIISQNLGWNKQQLMWWANQMGLDGKNHRDAAQKEADAGTIAHEMIEFNIQNKEWDIPNSPILTTVGKFEGEIIDKAETCYLNFLDWKKQVQFKPLHTELHLVSEKHQYGATPDCIAEINSKPALFDWKTGSGLYPDMLIQIAAYIEVIEETEAIKGEHPFTSLTGGAYLLRIGKEDASWHYHHWDVLPEAWEAFEYLLGLHKLQKILKKKV